MIGVIANKIKGLAAFAWAMAAAAVSLSSAHAADLVAVRFGETSPTETRIVFDSNGLMDYDLGAAGPGDLVVSFSGAQFARTFAASGKGAGHVAAFAARQTPGGAAEVMLNLRSAAKIKGAFAIPPSSANPRHRLVIDLVSAKPGDLVASLPPKKYGSMVDVIKSVAPAPAAGSAEQPQAPVATDPAPALAASTRLPVIVIDAGHGGSDPGAAGPAGTRESAATLAASLALAELLSETGRYEVVLTRSKDIRLAHEERSRIARDAKADLFISLHADAHTDAKVRGGSIYTLSDEGTERSAREALAQGNYHVFDLDIGDADPQVGGILYNLAQRKTGNESDRFAEMLISKLSGVTPLLNNTHRRGNFRVLLAPDVPAVLLELAFISNKHDETNLGSATWRKRSMGAVTSAIDAYFKQRAAALHASNAPASAPR